MSSDVDLVDRNTSYRMLRAPAGARRTLAAAQDGCSVKNHPSQSISMEGVPAMHLPRTLECPAARARECVVSGSLWWRGQASAGAAPAGWLALARRRYTVRPVDPYHSGVVTSRRVVLAAAAGRETWQLRLLHTVPGTALRVSLPSWQVLRVHDVYGTVPQAASALAADRIEAGGAELVRRVRALAADLDALVDVCGGLRTEAGSAYAGAANRVRALLRP